MALERHQTYLIEEFAEDYREHRLARRDLLRRVLVLTGSVPLTATMLFSLGCGSSNDDDAAAPVASATVAAPAATPATSAGGSGPGVSETDPAIQAAAVRFPGQAGDVLGYLSRPRGNGPYPAVIVIHENRGLVDQTKDVTRRYAKEGFVALAVDLASRAGGTTSDLAVVMSALRAPSATLVADLTAGLTYLKAQPFVRAASVGVTGFCFGGGMTWDMAVATPELKAAVPYYGTAQLGQVGSINAAVLAIYGANDTRITAQGVQVEQEMKAAGKTIQVKVYPDANHAFFNDTGGSYNKVAAEDAWQQTLAWFRRYLSA